MNRVNGGFMVDMVDMSHFPKTFSCARIGGLSKTPNIHHIHHRVFWSVRREYGGYGGYEPFSQNYFQYSKVSQ
jgi:hypothetical protein